MSCVDNPPWTDKLMKRFGRAISGFAEDYHLPMPTQKSEGKQMMLFEGIQPKGKLTKELGCGAYGCVFKTSDPNMVFKFTSDASEALAIANTISLDIRADGMARFKTILRLEDAEHRGLAGMAPVFAVWREEFDMRHDAHFPESERKSFGRLKTIQQLGNMAFWLMHEKTDFPKDGWDIVGTAKDSDSLIEAEDMFEKHFGASYESGDFILPSVMHIGDRLWRSNRKMFFPWIAFVYLKMAQELEYESEYFEKLGEMFGVYWKWNMLIGDVHAGNVAFARQEVRGLGWDKLHLVAIDPGHTVALNRENFRIFNEIPVLKESR